MTSQSPSENVRAIREITKVMVESESWLKAVTPEQVYEQTKQRIERAAERAGYSTKEPDTRPEINCEDCSGLLW